MQIKKKKVEKILMICIKTDAKLGPGVFIKLRKSRADGEKTESHIVFYSYRAIIYYNNIQGWAS
jgi:hypothetical protein